MGHFSVRVHILSFSACQTTPLHQFWCWYHKNARFDLNMVLRAPTISLRQIDTSETIAFRRDQTKPPPPFGHSHMKQSSGITNNSDTVSFELARNLQAYISIVLQIKMEHCQLGKPIAAEYKESLSVDDNIPDVEPEESQILQTLPDSDRERVEDIQVYARGELRGRGSRCVDLFWQNSYKITWQYLFSFILMSN